MRTVHIESGPDTYDAVQITDENAKKLMQEDIVYPCGEEDGHDLHLMPDGPLSLSLCETVVRSMQVAAATPLQGMQFVSADETKQVQGLPVLGYKPTQSQEMIDLVNEGKILEERVLRWAWKVEDSFKDLKGFTAIPALHFLMQARMNIQMGFMLAYRAAFQPEGSRIALPEDAQPQSEEDIGEAAVSDPLNDPGDGSAAGEKHGSPAFHDPFDII